MSDDICRDGDDDETMLSSGQISPIGMSWTRHTTTYLSYFSNRFRQVALAL